MDIKDLIIGKAVFIRKDLNTGELYGAKHFTGDMKKSIHIVKNIYSGKPTLFKIKDDMHENIYTLEMIDWEKTREIQDGYVYVSIDDKQYEITNINDLIGGDYKWF